MRTARVMACAESPVRRYQYDAQPQTEPAGSGKPVARRDERMGYGHKTQRWKRQNRKSGDCGDRHVTTAVEQTQGAEQSATKAAQMASGKTKLWPV
jgi:hypothetical protein